MKLTSLLAGAVLTIGIVVAAAPSLAASLVGTPSDATGINDLVVGTTTYDVTFVGGSYNSVYATTPPTFLGDFADAQTASNEIDTFLNLSGVTALNFFTQEFAVPFAISGSSNSFIYNTHVPPWTDNGSANATSSIADLSLDYAVFTVAPAPGPIAGVGLPGLLVFIGSGVLVWWRRKRNATAVAA